MQNKAAMTGGKNRTPRVTLAGESPVASRRKTRASIRTTVSAEKPPRERVSLCCRRGEEIGPARRGPGRVETGDASCFLPGCLQPRKPQAYFTASLWPRARPWPRREADGVSGVCSRGLCQPGWGRPWGPGAARVFI